MTGMKPDFAKTRLTLIERLKHWSDERIWQDFFDAYWKLIYGVALKAGLTHDEAQEVVQETIITVAKKIKDLKYDPALGTFKGWLLNTTRWKIHDQLRKRQRPDAPKARRADDTSTTDPVNRIPDPAGFDLEAAWDDVWRKNLVDEAIRKVKGRVNAQQYQMFHLNVLKEMPAAKVAKALGVSTAQVHLAKHRVTAQVRKEVKRLEKEIV